MSEMPPITICRSRDPEAIENLLTNQYFDGPVCFFPQRLIRAAAAWLAASNSVFFIVAEASGQHAGFIFAHSLGPALWRSFTVTHLQLLPLICCALLRRRIPWLRRKSFARFSHARPIPAANRIAELDLPKIDQPFAWTPPDSRTAYVDLLSVAQSFRGRNVACSMLREMDGEVKKFGIRRVEAHVDYANYASARAFLKAGWSVVKTSTNDLWAFRDLERSE